MEPKHNAFFGTILLSASLVGSVAAADINRTTDRYTRNKYGCMVSTQDGVKPEFSESEHAWASWMTGLADLTHDGIPEVIAGYEHEYSEGYGSWNREIYQYGFYSTDREFDAPPGTRFLAARTMLTQDFNADGLDDVVFIQHGPDFPPYAPSRNEILLSSADGYQTSYMNGGVSLFHGGAAGDFDGDGDIDVVVTPGPSNEILLLYNDGTGNFKKVRKLTGYGRIYNIKAWDLDNDGYLDLIFDGHEEPVKILWGEHNGKFSNQTTVHGLNSNNLMQDAVFLKNERSGTDIFLNSSLSVNEKLPYQGYSIDRVSLKERSVVSISNIDKVETPDINLRVWLNFIHACDLSLDDDIDIVFESLGSNYRFLSVSDDWIFLDKIVWENVNGTFVRHAILDSNHRLVPGGIIPKNHFGEDLTAKHLGISLNRYLPSQTYAQTTAAMPFLQRYRRLIDSIVIGKEINPQRSWNSGAELSDAARRILEKRKQQRTAQEQPSLSGSTWSSGAKLSDRAQQILKQREQKRLLEK